MQDASIRATKSLYYKLHEKEKKKAAFRIKPYRLSSSTRNELDKKSGEELDFFYIWKPQLFYKPMTSNNLLSKFSFFFTPLLSFP